jgi:hypothetical protein
VNFLSQNFLATEIVGADKINPAVGTIELRKGLGASIDQRKITTTTYVIIAIRKRLVLLVSQALSDSTNLFLSIICCIYWFNCAIILFLHFSETFFFS